MKCWGTGGDGVVEFEFLEGGLGVGDVDVAFDVQLERRGFELSGAQGDEEFLEVAVDFGAEGAGGILALVGGDFDGDDGVGFDLDEGRVGFVACGGQVCAPLFLVAEVAAVGDDQGGALGVMRGDVRRVAVLDDEGDAADLEVGADVGEALEHEEVVAGVGFGVVVHQPEADEEWEGKGVGAIDGVFKRVVVAGALGLLHPIEDVGVVWARGVVG
ncbi:MAG: hypothetical protein JWN40_1014 [Phycisphaerales bacterium]|nr:hypothetical protein [Phycisphaerales bacterium]